MTGSDVTMENWLNLVPAILQLWYPGEEGGHAVADVLFGDYNSGGRLTITFPRQVGQTPFYLAIKPEILTDQEAVIAQATIKNTGERVED